ncbi:MAG TPA: outer membrane beta-barrel protein [Steroidobacteraceae bacterium]|jgi:opacity protein-like surface antigen
MAVKKQALYTLGALLALACASPAMAQFYYSGQPYRPLHWQIEGGYSATVGTTSDYLNGGWTIGGGLTWYPSPRAPLALRVDLSYSEYDATHNLLYQNQTALQTRIDSGTGRTWGGDVDGQYDFALAPGVNGYLIAGVGTYRREIALYQTVLGGGIFCDPWWGFCGPAYFPAYATVAETTSAWQFAWNAGVGINFPLGNGMSWFVDARYLRIGPADQKGEFIPVRIGLRF